MVKMTFEDGYNQALKDYEECKDIEKLWDWFSYSIKGFWFHNPKKKDHYDIYGNYVYKNDYKIIITRYDKGYKKGLQEIEKRIKVESNNEIR